MRHEIHDLLAPLPGTARQVHSFHFGPPQVAGKVYIQSSPVSYTHLTLPTKA